MEISSQMWDASALDHLLLALLVLFCSIGWGVCLSGCHFAALAALITACIIAYVMLCSDAILPCFCIGCLI